MKQPISNGLGIALTLALGLSSTSLFADWHCACGTIVHVNYPTACPTCGRNLPNSSFPQPGAGAPDSSGVTLGVRLYNAGPRVIVESVLPNTPAQGRLFPNDQLVRGAFRDAASGQVHRVNIYSPADVTRLKTLAGAGTQVALRVFRPTGGARNFFVSFAAPGGVTTRAYQVQVNGRTETRTQQVQQQARTATITEDTTGEAASMLGGDAGSAGGPPVIIDQGSGQSGGDSAADLLGN